MHKKAVKPTSSKGNFGEVITAENALPASELPKLLEGKNQIDTKLVGNIDAVCQMTGCWIDVTMDNGETIHVTLKDDAFLLPKDATGKKTEGKGSYDTMPVSLLKHLRRQ
jgi:hypothetical protein